MDGLSDQPVLVQARVLLKRTALLEVAAVVGLGASEQAALAVNIADKIRFLDHNIPGFAQALPAWRAEIKERARHCVRWHMSLRSGVRSLEVPAFATQSQGILPAYSLQITPGEPVYAS